LHLQSVLHLLCDNRAENSNSIRMRIKMQKLERNKEIRCALKLNAPNHFISHPIAISFVKL
jgi:hypothetical protein